MAEGFKKHNYILNFTSLPVIIRTSKGDYGPIEPDGEVIFHQDRTRLSPNHPSRLFIKQFFNGNGLSLQGLSWDVEVKMGNRFVPFPAPRSNVLILVGFDAACAIKISGRSTSDLIITDTAEAHENIAYCDKFVIFR